MGKKDEATGEDLDDSTDLFATEIAPPEDEIEIVMAGEEGEGEGEEEGEGSEVAGEEATGEESSAEASGEEAAGEELTGEEGESDPELESFPAKIRQRFERERRLRNTIIGERDQARNIALTVAQKAQQTETELATVRRQNAALQRQFADTLEYAYDSDIRIKTAELRKARDEDDRDAEMRIESEITALRFQQNQVRQAKLALPKEDAPAPAAAPSAPAPAAAPSAAAPKTPPAPLAVKWLNSNKVWFNNPKFRAHRSFALEVDNELGALGYDKQSPEYYAELDRRIDEAFPTLRKKPTKAADNAVAPVGKGAASAVKTIGGKRVVKITKADMQNMRRYGLDPNNKDHLNEYARNKAAA